MYINVYVCFFLKLKRTWVNKCQPPMPWRQVQLLPWRSIAAAGVPGASSPQFSKAVPYPGQAAAHRRWLWWLGGIIQSKREALAEVTYLRQVLESSSKFTVFICWVSVPAMLCSLIPATYPAVSSRILRLRRLYKQYPTSNEMRKDHKWLNVPAPAIYAVVTSSWIGDPPKLVWSQFCWCSVLQIFPSGQF